MRTYFEIAGGQIDGARDYQEDAFLHSYIDDGDDPKGSGLVIMADGMGGHAAGNIASNLVVSTFNKTFNAGFDNGDIPNLLRVSLAKANGALSEAIRETPALDGMGCTMVSGVFHEGKVWWVSVGDSHLYLIRDRDLKKHNEDHSYGGYLDRMAAQGMAIEPEPGLSRNMLMSAMTGDDIAEIDCPNDHVQLLPGDRLLIASDGLDTLSAGTIVQMSAWSSTPKECVEALLKAVEDANKPRQDNTTVIVVDCLDRDAGESAKAPAAKAAPDLGDTQEIKLSDIEELAADSAPATEPAAQARAPAATPSIDVSETAVPRSQDLDDDDDDDEGISIVRVVVVILVLLALLGGIGYGAWVWYSGSTAGPDTTTPQPTDGGTGTTGTAGGSDTGGTTGTTGTGGTTSGGTTSGSGTEVTQGLENNGGTQGQGSTGQTGQGQAQQGQTNQQPQPPARPASREFRDALSAGGEAPVMVVLSGGTFTMGKNSFDQPNEGPARDVSVPNFAVSKFEVTQGEYEQFAKATGREIPTASVVGTDYPVVNVTWDDAVAYARWLSDQTGEIYRLLSESEWEYVAGAGTAQSYWWGFDFLPGKAHCFDCATDFTTSRPTRVGSFEPNPFGVHDTAGNVLEWVQDCYHANYSGAPTDSSVWEGGDCSRRIARGGAYNSPSDSLRVQKRDAYNPGKARRNIGFRIAREM